MGSQTRCKVAVMVLALELQLNYKAAFQKKTLQQKKTSENRIQMMPSMGIIEVKEKESLDKRAEELHLRTYKKAIKKFLIRIPEEGNLE